MKKKILLIMLAIVSALCLVFGITACGGKGGGGEKGEDGHTHRSSVWEFDETSHWKTCTVCGDTFATGNHEFHEGACVCGMTQGGHIHSAEKWSTDETSHWKVCVECGEQFSKAKHSIKEGSCTVCGYSAIYTQGLEYEFNEETKSYIVRGMGEVKDSVVSIPSYYLGKPVTSIRYGAFRNCTSLESITIPKGVTEIGSWAFEGCVWLEKILLPDGILEIGTDAFLDTVFYETASNWVKDMLYIGKYLISTKENISGTCVIKPGTILIADSAFSERDQITSVTIPESVTSIGDEAFNKCSALTNVKFEGDSQLASIGYDVFNRVRDTAKNQNNLLKRSLSRA